MKKAVPPIQSLVSHLRLKRIEKDLFVGQSYDPGWGRVYGGQVLGQALSAAQTTVDDVHETNRHAHSLHSYFLLPGNVHLPIAYDVERIRDGRSFSARRVKAIQNGQPIFFLTASFQNKENNTLEHQYTSIEHSIEHNLNEYNNIPPPNECLPIWDVFDEFLQNNVPKGIKNKFKNTFGPTSPIQIRPVSMQNPIHPVTKKPQQDLWIRSNGTLKKNEENMTDFESESLHRALLSFASDYGLLETALNPHAVSLWDPKQRVNVATIDHSIWFHAPFQFDEWFLHRTYSPIASSSRGLCFGEIMQNGKLVASTAQQGLMRKNKSFEDSSEKN